MAQAPAVRALDAELRSMHLLLRTATRFAAGLLPVGILMCRHACLPHRLTARATALTFPVVAVYRVDPLRVMFASFCPAFTTMKVRVYDLSGAVVAQGIPVRPTDRVQYRTLQRSWNSIPCMGQLATDLIRRDAVGVVAVRDQRGVWCGLCSTTTRSDPCTAASRGGPTCTAPTVAPASGPPSRTSTASAASRRRPGPTTSSIGMAT